VGGERGAGVTVAVLGGGPAGLAAATALVRAGRAAVVHEAGTYPRHRVCGEFLSPDAGPPLATLGLEGLEDRLGAPVIGAVRLTASSGGRSLAETGFALERPGRGLSRFDLDAALAEHARRQGAEVLEGSRTLHPPRGSDAVLVATGRGPRPGDGPSPAGGRGWIGVKVHVRGIDLPGLVELHLVDGAYAGLNEVACGGERVVNACALFRADAWDRAGRSPEGAWRLLAAESPGFAARWRLARIVDGSGAAAAGFDFRPRGPVAEGGALAVGDAAGVSPPFSGAGQAAALASGIEAARVLAEPGAAAAWPGRFRRRFRGRLAVGGVLQRTLLASSTAPATLRIVAAVGPAATWLYRATRGAW
jgi:flavin-dependent dehydrogenase